MNLLTILFLSYKFLVIPEGNFQVILGGKEIKPVKTGWIRNLRVGIFDIDNPEGIEIKGNPGNYPFKGPLRKVIEKIVLNKEDIDKFSYRINYTCSFQELPFERAIKIYTKEEGIYRIYGSLLRRKGIDIDTLNPWNAHIFYRGREIPFFFRGEEDGVFNDGDYIEFIAEKIRGENTFYHPYTDFNSYFLYFDYKQGLRLIKKNLPPFDSTKVIPLIEKKYHFEKDSIFMDFTRMQMSNTDSFDLWYWKILTLNKPETLLFEVEKPDTQRKYILKFYFETLETQEVNYPKHGVEIRLNENFVDTIFWESNQPFLDSILLKGKFLKNGYNYLVLKEDSAFSNIAGLLNWFEIKGYFYPEWRRNSYKINPGNDTFSIILKNGKREKVNIYLYPSIKFGEIGGIFKNGKYDYHLTLEPFQSGYYFISDTFFIPESVEVYQREEIIYPSEGADIIVITPEEFYSKALLYKNHREGKGYSVKVVRVEDIYNQFSYGIKNPYAIRDFLKNAVLKWEPPPFAVILFGDASYDPKNIENNVKDFIPTFLYPAKAPGQAVYYSRPASTDIYYTLLIGEDPFPDILLGRIPVNSLTECEIYLSKIFEYEENPEYGWWRISPLFLTEVHQQDGTIFFDACEKLKEENIPPEFDSRIIALSSLQGFKGYKFPQILNELSKGSPLITFIGHASTTFRTIFREKTFKAERWYEIYNFKRPPLFIAMSCWVGDFAGFSEKYSWYDPGKSFLELPLFLSGRGIIGYMGVTASSPSPGFNGSKNITYLLPEGILKGFYTEGLKTPGELHLFSRLYSLLYIPEQTGETKDVYYTFNLIGDPLLEIPEPKRESLIINPLSILPDDTLFVQANPDSIFQGRVIERIAIREKDTGFTFYKMKEYSHLPFKDSIPINYSGINAKGEVRVYFFNSSIKREATGFSRFSLNGAFVKNIEFIPPLADTEYHNVKAIIECVREIDTSFLLWSYGDSLSNPFILNLERKGDTFFTQIPIGPLHPSDKFSICFYIIDKTGSSFYTDTLKYKVPSLADLSAGKIGIVPEISTKTINLVFPIFNQGERRAEEFKYFLKIIKNGDTIFSKIDTTSLNPFSSDTQLIALKHPQYFGKIKIYYSIDFDNRVEESNEYNNSKIIDDFENKYLYIVDSTPWIELRKQLDLKIIPSDTDIYEVKFIEKIPKIEGIKFIDTLSGISVTSIINPEFEKDTQISFRISFQDSVELFKFDKDSLWHRIERTSNSPSPLWILKRGGVFSFGYIKDKSGPDIKILLNGKNLEENQKIKTGSEIDFLFSDSSGIEINYKKPEILLDDFEISDSLNFNRGVQNPKVISAKYRLKGLKEGLHTLKIKVYDCVGNYTKKELSFTIFEPFEIIFRGIYPNPARGNKVVIAFENTKELDWIRVRILTLSGRTIYEFEPYMDPVRPPITRKGKHWLEWFLCDMWGNKVANGVYLLYIEGKWQNKTKKIIQKIGVLR